VLKKNKVIFTLILSILIGLSMAGCSTQDKLDDMSKAESVKVAGQPLNSAPAELPPYRIQIGDVLDLRMIANPELTEEMVVRPDGMVSTTLVQDVRAYGLTPKELQKKMIELYKKELSKPQLTIIVKNFAPTRVYVMGEVQNPGEQVFIGPNLTLMQAVARAGGMKTTAETGQVMIMRRGEGDKPELYKANFDAAATGKDISSDVRLAPFDVVFVPRSSIAEANVMYEQYFKNFVSPSIGASYSFNNN
jgi:polysaccharide export outer membrane protein